MLRGLGERRREAAAGDDPVDEGGPASVSSTSRAKSIVVALRGLLADSGCRGC